MKNITEKLKFIDLFAGIGGFRLAFEKAGCECVYSSDWDKFCVETYRVNFGEIDNRDIRDIKYDQIPDFDILTGGFPCQPFSIAGVSAKNALGRRHGFEDEHQGNLFFSIADILKVKRPRAFLLENVKHLKNHDKKRTFTTIKDILIGLNYNIFYDVLDGQYYVPQHRERIFIVGFNRDFYHEIKFEFPEPPANNLRISDILKKVVDPKYTISDRLWEYLKDYAIKHRMRGNGFGYNLMDTKKDRIARTLSARYYKDGSEILIKQSGKNPRRLTPRECARLMGFSESFKIPVSDTQAYKQFGNAVIVPLVHDIAKRIIKTLNNNV